MRLRFRFFRRPPCCHLAAGHRPALRPRLCRSDAVGRRWGARPPRPLHRDAGGVVADARRLVELGRAGGWYALQVPEYDLFLTEFRRSAERLSQAAGDKNIDGATLAYHQLTVSCVACHKYFRGDPTRK